MANAERCVCCGEIVPEGRMVCPNCEVGSKKRLIDANALKKAIKSFRWFGVPNTLQLMFVYLNIIIRDQPTVDAVEEVHGRWDRWWCDNYLQYFHRCSVCGYDALTADGTMHDEVLSNYCPNCGAKMDGERKDNGM